MRDNMSEKCWICGDEASSREHKVKASDVRMLFGNISSDDPAFVHTDSRRNVPLLGVKSNRLKWTVKICTRCNNERTQPYDEKWRILSRFLNERGIKRNDIIRLEKAFPGAVRSSMLLVHLYFVKLFGCAVVEASVPIDIGPFSKALLSSEPHPDLHLSFSASTKYKGRSFVGATDIETVNHGNRCACAEWFYILRNVTVRVVYSHPSHEVVSLSSTWHPNNVNKRLKVV